MALFLLKFFIFLANAERKKNRKFLSKRNLFEYASFVAALASFCASAATNRRCVVIREIESKVKTYFLLTESVATADVVDAEQWDGEEFHLLIETATASDGNENLIADLLMRIDNNLRPTFFYFMCFFLHRI